MIPLGKRVFIRPEIQTRSHGGIEFARMSMQMPDRGIIIALSPQAKKALPDVKAGDKVLYDKHHQALNEDQSGTVIEHGHVLAILT